MFRNIFLLILGQNLVSYTVLTVPEMGIIITERYGFFQTYNFCTSRDSKYSLFKNKLEKLGLTEFVRLEAVII